MHDPPGDDPPGGNNQSDDTHSGSRGKKRCRTSDGEASLINCTTPDKSMYQPFIKPGYKRVFAENSINTEFVVYLESTKEGEKLGNKNPSVLNTLLQNEIKGIHLIHRVNANKVAVIFTQANNANNFLKNVDFQEKHAIKTFIPARAVEKIGVLKYVPVTISNEELFRKLQSDCEIISVRRFQRKVNGELTPYQSVSVTFLTNVLPKYVYLDLYRFQVNEYVPPLMQCFKCFKYNHGAKICKGVQTCSICASNHHFLDCDSKNVIKCVNCGGSHLAISRDCPIKQKKLEEKKKVTKSYAEILHHNSFPVLPKPRPQPTLVPEIINKTKKVKEQFNVKNTQTIQNNKNIEQSVTNCKLKKTETLKTKELIEEILKNDDIIASLIKTLVELGNSTNTHPLTFSNIKEVLKKSLVFNG